MVLFFLGLFRLTDGVSTSVLVLLSYKSARVHLSGFCRGLFPWAQLFISLGGDWPSFVTFLLLLFAWNWTLALCIMLLLLSTIRAALSHRFACCMLSLWISIRFHFFNRSLPGTIFSQWCSLHLRSTLGSRLTLEKLVLTIYLGLSMVS